MLKKLIWCAMHSQYFPLVRFNRRSLIPIEWQIQSEFRGHWRLEVWPISPPDLFYFPWECERAFKTRKDAEPWRPLPPPPPSIYDPTLPDYDDIPF
ncbi:hypothetical protein NDA01_21805 [Trichocoleus desertorum AS-A10]|uniref:hypothetical protein n=1 Tax=Trichocoleus desertorum TaxID=1481672 RepID=UPI00329A1317